MHSYIIYNASIQSQVHRKHVLYIGAVMLRGADAHRFRLYTARPEKHIHHYDQRYPRYYTWPSYAPVARRLTCMLQGDAQYVGLQISRTHWEVLRLEYGLEICVDLWPISILPIISKVLEKLMRVYKRVYKFLNQSDYFYKYQFGFRETYSTELALITLNDKISTAFNRNRNILGIFLDLSKAFDTVNFPILLRTTMEFGGFPCYGWRTTGGVNIILSLI